MVPFAAPPSGLSGAASMPALGGALLAIQAPMFDAASAAAAAAFAAIQVDPEVERRKKEALKAAREERSKLLKRGPGVAALVQGALKRAQEAPAVKKDDEKPAEKPKDANKRVEQAAKKRYESEEDTEETKKRKREEMAKAEEKRRRERVEKAEMEAREKEKAEREAAEKRERAKLEAAEAEKALQQKEAETRDQRIKASVETAKKQQAERSAGRTGKEANLYDNMPQPDLEDKDQAAADAEAKQTQASAKEKENKYPHLPPEDHSKVIFLDVDGVLRPARAGGFDVAVGDAEAGAKVDTSDFFAPAMKALKHIVERTGATIVLSSEWRRNEAHCAALTDVFDKHRLRPWSDVTTVSLKMDTGPDLVRCFAERRAREVSAWMQKHEDKVTGWVVLDDINLAVADEAHEKRGGMKGIAPRLVQTWPLCGLTPGNAKTAVRILNGEMINKVVVERPVAPGGGLFAPVPKSADEKR